MHNKAVRVSGICFPGALPEQHTQVRSAVYTMVFLGMIAMIAAGVDVHTAAVTLLAAGYVASEIAHQVMDAMAARGAMPVTA